MMRLNLYSLTLPFLFVFTIPIAILASITTTLAFSILIFRVLLVYIELAFAVIPFWIFGLKQSGQVLRGSKAFSSPPSVPARRRKRRGSTNSSLSATGTITPIPGDAMRFNQSIGATRDFEGVGGWRLDNPSDDDDSLWTKINSRLELPADHGRRHHHRSPTSGSNPSDLWLNRGYSAEATMNTSRPRTPPSGPTGDGFPPQTPISIKRSKRTASAHTSGSSGSSGRSSVMSMKQK